MRSRSAINAARPALSPACPRAPVMPPLKSSSPPASYSSVCPDVTAPNRSASRAVVVTHDGDVGQRGRRAPQVGLLPAVEELRRLQEQHVGFRRRAVRVRGLRPVRRGSRACTCTADARAERASVGRASAPAASQSASVRLNARRLPACSRTTRAPRDPQPRPPATTRRRPTTRRRRDSGTFLSAGRGRRIPTSGHETQEPSQALAEQSDPGVTH